VPTGELRDSPAMDVVRERIPERTYEERLAAYADTLRRLNALGICGAHVMLGRPELFDVLDELEARGARHTTRSPGGVRR
jgi:predicted amidohydrolase YtcJ